MLNLLLITTLAFAEEVPTSAVEAPTEKVLALETKVELPVLEEIKKELEVLKPELAETKEDAKPVSEVKAEEVGEAEVPVDYDEAAETVSLLVKAVQDKNWALAIGLLLTLLVFVANKFGLKEKVGSKMVPWIATGLAVFAALGVSLANGLPVMDAITQGILAGLAAIGGWEMLFKHFLAPKKATELTEG